METMYNRRRDLPHSTTVLVLGILSLAFIWSGGLPGLVLGIIAVAMAGPQRRDYRASPAEYTESSFRNVNSGRTCGIIAICISAFMLLFGVLVIMGVVALGLTVASFGL